MVDEDGWRPSWICATGGGHIGSGRRAAAILDLSDRRLCRAEKMNVIRQWTDDRRTTDGRRAKMVG